MRKMNLAIKSNFWEEVKDNLYNIVRKSNYEDFNGLKSSRISRCKVVLSYRNKEPKTLRPFFYVIRDNDMFKNFWGDINAFENKVVFYKESKRSCMIAVSLERAILNGRLYSVDGIMFYQPTNQYHWFVCTGKNHKVIGLEEEVIS